MFDNVGDKIQKIAYILMGFEGIAGIIWVITLFLAEEPIPIFLGLLLLVAVAFASWATACILYGFGELINKLTDLVGFSYRNNNQ